MPAIHEILKAAIDYQQRGHYQEAENLYRQIISADPQNVAAWHLLGRLAWQTNNREAAIGFLRKAIQLKADYAECHSDLGTFLTEERRFEEATACFRRAIELKPQYAEAHFNLGKLYYDNKDLDEAVSCYRRAIKANPDLALAHFNLGIALLEQGNLQDAIGRYRQALRLQPNWADAHYNFGNALAYEGNYEEAFARHHKALELDPGHGAAHAGLALLLLQAGDFERGWSEYEWRWKSGQQAPRNFSQPRWEGQGLHGRTILLHAEQGLGDTLQFVRFAPLVKARRAKVIVECPRPLFHLLGSCQGIDDLIPLGLELPAFDFQVPLLSIPGILETSLDTIPANVPYLFAKPELIAVWRERLGSSARKVRVGIHWRGGEATVQLRKRDIPLEFFRDLAALPDIQLISLQKGAEQELRAARDRIPIMELEGLDTLNGAFMDTAAIMMNLDLVITSDTSIAHLAGGLGVPVWVALPFVPDWRWLLNRYDSPWYPTMRLFRQKKPGGWTDVFVEIEGAIKGQLAGKLANAAG